MKRNECFDGITGMLLPQAPEVEHGVLGALVSGCVEVDEVVEMLQADDFYFPVHQIIYRQIVDLHKAGEKIDLLSIVNALGTHPLVERAGGVTFLSRLSSDISFTSLAMRSTLVVLCLPNGEIRTKPKR